MADPIELKYIGKDGEYMLDAPAQDHSVETKTEAKRLVDSGLYRLAKAERKTTKKATKKAPEATAPKAAKKAPEAADSPKVTEPVTGEQATPSPKTTEKPVTGEGE